VIVVHVVEESSSKDIVVTVRHELLHIFSLACLVINYAVFYLYYCRINELHYSVVLSGELIYVFLPKMCMKELCRM